MGLRLGLVLVLVLGLGLGLGSGLVLVLVLGFGLTWCTHAWLCLATGISIPITREKCAPRYEATSLRSSLVPRAHMATPFVGRSHRVALGDAEASYGSHRATRTPGSGQGSASASASA